MTYCSFALILVVFFAMMVSYSIVSGKGMKAIRKHFTRGASLHAPGSSMQPLSGIKAEESGDTPAILIQDATSRFGLGNTVSVRMNSEGIDVVMKDRILFTEGAVDVQKRIYPYLNVIGDVAARNGLHVQVKARAAAGLAGGDKVDRSSWELSAQRAVNVMRYFLAYGRLASDQVSASGSVLQGETQTTPGEGSGIELHLSVNE
jgi:chemotaxis protein MotB